MYTKIIDVKILNKRNVLHHSLFAVMDRQHTIKPDRHYDIRKCTSKRGNN